MEVELAGAAEASGSGPAEEAAMDSAAGEEEAAAAATTTTATAATAGASQGREEQEDGNQSTTQKAKESKAAMEVEVEEEEEGDQGIKASATNPVVLDEDEDEPMCRYCFGGTEDGPLISPCLCAGGQKASNCSSDICLFFLSSLGPSQPSFSSARSFCLSNQNHVFGYLPPGHHTHPVLHLLYSHSSWMILTQRVWFVSSPTCLRLSLYCTFSPPPPPTTVVRAFGLSSAMAKNGSRLATHPSDVLRRRRSAPQMQRLHGRVYVPAAYSGRADGVVYGG